MESHVVSPIPPDLKISTITAVGSLNSFLDLDIVFDCCPLVPPDHATSGVVHVEYGKTKHELRQRGVRVENTFAVSCGKRRRERKHHFDNQATLLYRIVDLLYPQPVVVNIKVFRNGNMQITGLRRVEQGQQAIQDVYEMVRDIAKDHPAVVESPDAFRASSFRVCMINSDFRAGFSIKRKSLYDILTKDHPDMACSYEPCIYPGVKIKFMWSQLNQSSNQGVCRCGANRCRGKGFGRAIGDCRKITIAVFQSGCIIITGSHSYQQLNDAYAFITGVLHVNKAAVSTHAAL